MNWQDAIGILSTLALFTPVFVIVVTKLIRYKQYLPLFIYCLLAFGFNLMTEHLINVPKSVERFYGITNNLTDMPLMLGFLLFQIPSSVQKKRMKRSEERRVGKECRSRWSSDQQKKKKSKNR